MKTKLAKLIITMLCIIPVISLVSCGTDKSAQVYFLNSKPEFAEVYEEIVKKYKAEKGVTVKVVTAAANTYEQTLKSEIAQSPAPSIFQISSPVDYVGWKTYCLDIKDSKLYSYLIDDRFAIKEDGGVYGIACAMEGYGIIYNNAVMGRYFALPSKKTDYTSVNQINSFAALKAVVEDMTANLAKLGLEGVFASTSMAAGEDWRWHTQLLNIPLYYEFREKSEYGDPAIAGLKADAIENKYFGNYKNLFDLYINNSINPPWMLGSKSVADSMAEFALGRVAMVQNGSWVWPQISGVSGSAVKEGDVKYLPMYTGIEGEKRQGLAIGTDSYFIINKNTTEKQQKASLDFLEWLFSSETGKRYVTEKLKITTPFNTFAENEIPNDPLAREVYRYMNDKSLETVPWIFASFPGEAYKKSVGNALLDYAEGRKKWSEVEQTVKDKWKSER